MTYILPDTRDELAITTLLHDIRQIILRIYQGGTDDPS